METSMKDVVKRVTETLISSNLSFSQKPILIGGMAMEYYEMRKVRRFPMAIQQFKKLEVEKKELEW